jgi:hypothetical protein
MLTAILSKIRGYAKKQAKEQQRGELFSINISAQFWQAWQGISSLL